MSSTGESNPSTLRQDARGALPFAALSGALQILLSLVGMLLLVRYLPPDLFGVWAVLVGFTAPVILFTSFGFRHSLLRFLPALEELETRSLFLWPVLARRVLWVSLVGLALYFAFPFFAGRLGVEAYRNVFSIFLPSFVFLAASQYLVIGLNAGFRQREVFIGSLVLQTTSVTGIVIGINLEQGLAFFAAVQLTANAVYLLFNLTVSVYYLGAPKWESLKAGHTESPDQRQYRRTSFVDDIGNSFLSADINRFVVAAFSTTPQVAVYSVAASIVERLRALVPVEVFRPLATVTFFKRFEETGTIDEVNRMFAFLFAVNRIVTTAFLVLFIPLGYEAIVWVFRADYGASYLPIVLMLIAIGVFTIPIGIVAQALRRPKWLVYSKLAVLINIGLGIPLAMNYGAVGMAAATALAELIKNLIVFILLRTEFQIRYPWFSMLRFLVSGICVGLLLYWLDGYVHFLLTGAIGVITWFFAIRVFRILSHGERSLLVTVLPGRLHKVARLLIGT